MQKGMLEEHKIKDMWEYMTRLQGFIPEQNTIDNEKKNKNKNKGLYSILKYVHIYISFNPFNNLEKPILS